MGTDEILYLNSGIRSGWKCFNQVEFSHLQERLKCDLRNFKCCSPYYKQASEMHINSTSSLDSTTKVVIEGHYGEYGIKWVNCTEKNERIIYTFSMSFNFPKFLPSFLFPSMNNLSAMSFSFFCTSAGWRDEECCCFAYITSFPPIFTPTTIWVPNLSINLQLRRSKTLLPSYGRELYLALWWGSSQYFYVEASCLTHLSSLFVLSYSWYLIESPFFPSFINIGTDQQRKQK